MFPPGCPPLRALSLWLPSPAPPSPGCSLELPTVDVQAAVRLMAVQQGRGTAIVVSAVDPGSQAAAAGVRVGQQLLEVSDPIRYADTWPLNERASLRYVRECIRMRRDAVMQLVLTRQPIPEWQQAVAAARAAAAAEAQQEQAPDASTGSQDDGDNLLSAIVSAAAAGTSTDEGDSEAAAAAAAGRPLTMAEKLEQQYQQQQVEAAAEARLAQQQMTALQQRQARRRERLEVVSQPQPATIRCVFLAACLLLPPSPTPGIDTLPAALR